MALAIESDFLNVKPPKSQDSSARGSDKPHRGEAFADTLSKARSRDDETGTKKSTHVEAETATFMLPPSPQKPDLVAPNTDGKLAAVAAEAGEALPDMTVVEIATAQASAPVAEADMAALADPALGSELETDRDLATARTEIRLETPPEAPGAPSTLSPDVPLTPSVEPSDLAAMAQKSMTTPGNPAAPDAPASDAAPDEGAGTQTEAPLPITGETVSLAAGAGFQKPTTVDKSDGATSIGPVKSADPAMAKVPQPAQMDGPPAQADVPADATLAFDSVVDEPSAKFMGSGNKTAGTEVASQTPSAGAAVSLVSSAPSSAPVANVAAPIMTPTHAVLTASPADIVDIVAKSAGDGKSDSVVIQLDPPELGRVSIDFKFDAQGLQHITITGETPEALRQLRLMHFELTQALDRQGLGSHTMTFQQQQQNAQSSPAPTRFGMADVADDGAGLASGTLVAANMTNAPRSLPGGRLDIRL